MGELPPPLMVSDPGSFAAFTIAERKPQILQGVIESNEYPSSWVDALLALRAEMAAGPVAPLHEEAPDADEWRAAWRPWQGRSWGELSWFFAETFFYRRLLEAVRYFQPGPGWGGDPFAPAKHDELQRALALLPELQQAAAEITDPASQFAFWLHRSLWGNRADLSNLHVARRARNAPVWDDAAGLLVDHTAAVWEQLRGGAGARLAWVCDNAGLELLSDLALADWLLQQGLAGRIDLHLKGQPFYVSDAMPADVDAALAALSSSAHEALRASAARLEQARRAGRLTLQTHRFWTSCFSFWYWPEEVRAALGAADLILFKGDVNYRRLLDDRHWPPTTDLAQVAQYVPAPFVALRTLKGEIIVGLAEGEAERLAAQDPDWLVNGERGVIHFVARGA